MPAFLAPLLISLIPAAVNAAARYFNIPDDKIGELSNEDLQRLVALHTQAINRSTEATASLAGQAAAGRASGAGLSGGGFVSSVNQAESPIYQQGAQQIGDYTSQLYAYNAMAGLQGKQDRAAAKRDLWTGLVSDVGQAGLGTLASMQQDKYYKMQMGGAFGQPNQEGSMVGGGIRGGGAILPDLQGNIPSRGGSYAPQLYMGQGGPPQNAIDTGQSRSAVTAYPQNRGWDNVTRMGDDRINFGRWDARTGTMKYAGGGTYPDRFGTPNEYRWTRPQFYNPWE